MSRWDWNVFAAGTCLAWGLEAVLEARPWWVAFWTVLFFLNVYTRGRSE